MYLIIRDFINKYAAGFFVCGALIAIAMPHTATFLHPTVTYLLMTVLFLGFLATDYTVAIKEVFAWKYQLYLLFLTAIIVPILGFYLAVVISHFMHLGDAMSLTVLVLLATSSATISPVLSMLLGGVLERVQLNVILTSLLVAITMPLLFKLLLGKSLAIDVYSLSRYLAMVIMVPLFLAVIVRRLLPSVVYHTNKVASPVSVVLITLVIFASSAQLRNLIESASTLVIIAFCLAFIFYFFAFAVGWCLAFKSERKDRISAAIVTTWPNIGLAILLVNRYFQHDHPLTILYAVVFGVCWSLSLVPTKLIFSRAEKILH